MSLRSSREPNEFLLCHSAKTELHTVLSMLSSAANWILGPTGELHTVELAIQK